MPEALTAQEIFDKVVAHLRGMKMRSMLPSGQGCAYRGEDGAKCAVGCLIEDHEYREEMEGKRAFALVEFYPHISRLNPFVVLMHDLQYNVHDDVTSWGISGLSERGEERLHIVANINGLTYTPPTQGALQ